jgi:hypothetical protein
MADRTMAQSNELARIAAFYRSNMKLLILGQRAEPDG